jgi:hypothetical protein
MKTNFKKLALAGSVAALAGASIPAHAIIMGAPGEAALVPYATYLNQGGVTTMNTLVRITTPAQLGSDVIMNCYTAPHVSPGNAPAGNNCNNVNTYSQTPAEVSKTAAYHWFFLDQRSVHRLNGTFTASGDDTTLIDWAVAAGGNQLNGVVGYLLITTEAGAQGQAANFAFTAEAYLTYDVGLNPVPGINNEVVAMIPTLAMSDGADAGATAPTLDNNVVEWIGGTLALEASPLVTGERTIWANGVLNNYVYDLPVANNREEGNTGTISVVWNDRNAAAWNNMLAYRFNNQEESCSGQISLPDELNVVYIPPTVVAGAKAETPFTGFPGKWSSLKMVDPYTTSASDEAGASAAYVTEVCRAPGDAPAPTAAYAEDAFINGGFIKMIAVEPADDATFSLEGSAVFWSWPVVINNINNPDINGAPRTTLLGHSRGAFSTVN